VQLVYNIYNLCGPDPPTSQTDRQTDDMRWQDRALHYSASCGKNLSPSLHKQLNQTERQTKRERNKKTYKDV